MKNIYESPKFEVVSLISESNVAVNDYKSIGADVDTDWFSDDVGNE